MSRLTKLEPRWRKKGRRGVSPIIATILLVAITVVLAAVLYILISGLTGGSSSKPYTVGFGQGQPSTNGTATYETFSLSVTNDLNTGLFALKITTPAGSGLGGAAPTATCVAAATLTATTPLWTAKCGASSATQGWYGVIVSPNGVIFATYNGLTSSWTTQTTSPLVMSDSYSVVIVAGSSVDLAGAGNTLGVFGTASSSVSGTTVM
jgi:flagellin-like protein